MGAEATKNLMILSRIVTDGAFGDRYGRGHVRVSCSQGVRPWTLG